MLDIGIFRKIPITNNITRTDGTKSSNKAQITNISVSESYTTYIENGYKVIKIGSSGQTLTGKHSYTIKYTYNIGKDSLKDVDELYYNLIGNEWDTTIKKLSFTIKMPKTFDQTLLGFSSGRKGSTSSSNISFNVDGNTINGSTNKSLNVGEGVTIRLTLPEGYFINAGFKMDMFSIIIIVISICVSLIAILLWMKYGKGDKVVETIEFYPPEGFNSAEIGYIYKEGANNTSIISLLVYLANKGYLKIEQIEEEGVFRKIKSLKFDKLKDYDGNNENERAFLDGLFLDGRDSVTSSLLYDKFYKTVDKIKSNMNTKENKEQMFDSKSIICKKILIVLAIFMFCIITIKPVLEYTELTNLIFAILFPLIGFSVLFGMLFGNTSISIKIFGVIWGLGFGGIPWTAIVLPALLNNDTYLFSYFIGIICIMILCIFIKIMPKRTKYGNELFGKVKGFKRFLETAEKPQLEGLVEQNPEYFYNILPYTYALGVSQIWMKQFETIALKAPDWYDFEGDFNMNEFSLFMNTTMAAATTAMSSSPTSSDGGSSGGGSSGGGSGGGGGGSW